MSETLCWKCEKAYPNRGCPWADDFKPVKGWDAEKRIIGNGGHKIISYQVNRCPLFVKTERRGNKNDSETID